MSKDKEVPITITSYNERINKLSFRAWRRGFKEADIILGHFSDSHLKEMTTEELDHFEILLEIDDHELYSWIIETKQIPQVYRSKIMTKLNKFYKDAYKKL